LASFQQNAPELASSGRQGWPQSGSDRVSPGPPPAVAAAAPTAPSCSPAAAAACSATLPTASLLPAEGVGGASPGCRSAAGLSALLAPAAASASASGCGSRWPTEPSALGAYVGDRRPAPASALRPECRARAPQGQDKTLTSIPFRRPRVDVLATQQPLSSPGAGQATELGSLGIWKPCSVVASSCCYTRGVSPLVKNSAPVPGLA
jgi:hypothetical protein